MMSTRKKKARAPASFAARDSNFRIELGGEKINMVFSDRGQLLACDFQGYVADPQTGRKWTWLERDQPGLNDFLQEFVQNWYPFAYIGRKAQSGGRLGHEKAHGTEAEKREKWDAYQTFVEEKKSASPKLGLTRCRELAAKHFGVSIKTIIRHTK